MGHFSFNAVNEDHHSTRVQMLIAPRFMNIPTCFGRFVPSRGPTRVQVVVEIVKFATVY